MSEWVKKYRPKKLDDISGHSNIISIFKKYVKNKSMPNIIIHGNPGNGKTSTILALANEIYPPELINQCVFEFNASDQRGIDVVRNKIDIIAKQKIAKDIPFNIIILDEADLLTKDAQAALRKIIENYSKNYVFCLLCNNINNIIPPIKSRCVSFYYEPLTTEDIQSKLEYIAKSEQISIAPTMLKNLIQKTNGDLRQAIILLQHVYFTDSLEELLNIIPFDKYLKKIIDKNTSLLELNEIVNEIYLFSYNILDFIQYIFQAILYDKTITIEQKSRIFPYFSEVDHNINYGCNISLQLTYLIFNINKEIHS
jgi:replication factor C subunit 2/4